MDLAILIYAIDILDNISGVATTILAISIVTLSFIIFNTFCGESSDFKPHIKKIVLYALIPSICLITIIPSKTTMYTMAGLVVGESVIKSEQGSEILNKSYKLLNQKLDEQLGGLNDEH